MILINYKKIIRQTTDTPIYYAKFQKKEEDSKIIKINGTKNKDEIDPNFSSGIHLGHKITKIIKK